MSNPNLIELQTRSPEEHRAIAQKGGRAKSQLRKYAAKVREMKKKAKNGKLSQKDVDWFLARLEDPNASIIHIQQWLDELRLSINGEAGQVKLMDSAISLHKAHFGEKRQNLNMNVNMGIEEWERRLYGDGPRNVPDRKRHPEGSDGVEDSGGG